MNFPEVIRKILKDKRITQGMLAEKLGQKQSNISMPLSKGNITLEKLLEWLDALDYELVVQPKKGVGRRKEGEYVIERVNYPTAKAVGLKPHVDQAKV